MPKKLTQEEFIQKAKAIHGDKYDYSKTIYLGCYNKINIICKKHGIFKQIASEHISGSGCKLCRNENYKLKYSSNKEEFIKKAIKIHGEKYDYSLVNYTNAKNKIKIICKEHGTFKQLPHNHLQGRGCKQCSELILLKNNKTFIKNAMKVHGNKYDYSLVEYKGNKIKVKIICKEHGIFEQRPNGHLTHSYGCPKCNLSKGELKIERYLKEQNIDFISQYRFDDCKNKLPLPFDFYLTKYNICIEFDGQQHYDKKSKFYSKQLIKNDKIKTEYCLFNNINLIRIPYINIKSINEILNKELL